MKKRIMAVILLATSLSVTGCMNRGTAELNDKEKMSQVRVYKSNKTQIKRLMGEPQEVATLSNGKEEWTYVHYNTSMTGKGIAKSIGSFIPYVGLISVADTVANGGDAELKTKSLILTFNTKGTLVRKRVARGKMKT